MGPGIKLSHHMYPLKFLCLPKSRVTEHSRRVQSVQVILQNLAKVQGCSHRSWDVFPPCLVTRARHKECRTAFHLKKIFKIRRNSRLACFSTHNDLHSCKQQPFPRAGVWASEKSVNLPPRGLCGEGTVHTVGMFFWREPMTLLPFIRFLKGVKKQKT